MTYKDTSSQCGGVSFLASGSNILKGLRIAFDANTETGAVAGAGAGTGGVVSLGTIDRSPAQVEFVRANGAGFQSVGGAKAGSVAQRLLQSNFDVKALRTNATLRYDEWRAWDQTVLEVARVRLVGVQDLYAAGCVTNLPNALGHTVFSWERMSDFTQAELTMSGLTKAENDRMEFDYQNLPIPIIHKDFNINIRQLAASRNKGTPLDTTQIAYATKVVSEKIEQLLFLGSTALGTNNTIYGYTTTPARLTGSVTASWVTATGSQILGDTLTIIGALAAQNCYGPFAIYVSIPAFTHLGDDFKTYADRTILERLLAVPGVQSVKPAAYLTGGQVLFVQMTKEVVDIINGFLPIVVEWESEGGLVTNYKVMAIQVPRLRADYANQKGIAHYT
jgi:uncharacterized linocin/CFP29 family protein